MTKPYNLEFPEIEITYDHATPTLPLRVYVWPWGRAHINGYIHVVQTERGDGTWSRPVVWPVINFARGLAINEMRRIHFATGLAIGIAQDVDVEPQEREAALARALEKAGQRINAPVATWPDDQEASGSWSASERLDVIAYLVARVLEMSFSPRGYALHMAYIRKLCQSISDVCTKSPQFLPDKQAIMDDPAPNPAPENPTMKWKDEARNIRSGVGLEHL